MYSGKVLYSDGREVTVTDSMMLVKRTSYELKGVTRHGLQVIHPHRVPAFMVFLVGLMMMIMGAFRLIPVYSLPDLEIFTFTLSPNAIALGFGVLFLLLGTLAMALMKDHFALHIATAEGEKNVVVSRSRDYIMQIVNALNRAFLTMVCPTRKEAKRERRKYF